MKRALIFEPCPYHYTLVPGYVGYLNELDYGIDLLVYETFDPIVELAGFANVAINVLHYDDLSFKAINELVDFGSYDLIWITTLDTENRPWKNVFEGIGYYPSPRDGLYGTLHSVGRYGRLNLERERFAQIFTLMDVSHILPETKPLSLSDYGDMEESRRHAKSSETTLAMIGISMSPRGVMHALSQEIKTPVRLIMVGKGRDGSYLVKAFLKDFASMFLRSHRPNWRGTMPKNPLGIVNLIKHLDCQGSLESAALYGLIYDSDFLAANYEGSALRIFSEDRMSGTALLSLGFRKPMVINESAACAWGFDSQVAVVFPDGCFGQGLAEAVSMGSERYAELCSNLAEKDRIDHAKSLMEIERAILESRDSHSS